MENEMDLYAKTDEHVLNNREFVELLKRYPWLDPYQPNAEKAPWHWQSRQQDTAGNDLFINFWPHTGKAQIDGEYAVEGWEDIRHLVTRVIDICRNDALS
jgi:hypothetical protein